jgi:hypothetical protein
MYPDFLHGAPPTASCAAFIKESRMKFVNASKFYRKSGVRFGEHGAPVRFPPKSDDDQAETVRNDGLLQSP